MRLIERRIASVPEGVDRDPLLPLFMLADDSEAQVRSYYRTGDLFVCLEGTGEPIGLTLVTPKGPEEVELKAVAVAEDSQGRGIGQHMIRAVLDGLRRSGFRRAVV